MRDLGLVDFSEPVVNLLTQGMVTNIVPGTNRWLAMSKSLGNGVEPDEMINIYGADTVRIFMLFASPPEAELRWQEEGVEGAARFLRRINHLVWKWHQRIAASDARVVPSDLNEQQRALLRKTHQTIRGVTRDIEERMQFNTAIAKLMELLNSLADFDATVGDAESASEADLYVLGEGLQALVTMLAPFAPHFAEEMWEAMGHEESLAKTPWPTYDEALAREEHLEIPVQVNGKLRSRIYLSPEATHDQYEQAALADEKIQPFINSKQVVKIIVVPKRLVNLVVK